MYKTYLLFMSCSYSRIYVLFFFTKKKILFILTDLYESYFICIFCFIDFLNLLWQYSFYGILLFGIGCYLWQPVTCT